MWLYYLIAAIEGFSTLAVEILALRIAAPVTGSSSIVTSVFLGIILLALSAGYRRGGIIASRTKDKNIKQLLVRYLFFAGLYYAVISFGLETWMLQQLLEITGSYIGTLFITAFLLFFLPVFIASQTIPLLTELLDDASKGRAAGKMLFASTLGSFLGSVLTSIVLFQTLGVTLTALVVSGLLMASGALLLRQYDKRRARWIIVIAFIVCLVLWVTRQPGQDGLVYHFDSAYQQLEVIAGSYKDEPVRAFLTNQAYASAIYTDTLESPFEYIQEAVALTESLDPQRVLVIGTAGFTFPYTLVQQTSPIQQIDAVDIDPHVEQVASKYFLQTDLPENITFYPQSARYFLYQAKKKKLQYDVVFVDAFHGKSLPEELTTQEFFADLQQLLTDEGVVIANFILDTSLKSELASALFTTIESVFGEVRYLQTSTSEESALENFIITTRQLTDEYHQPSLGATIYTDDKRSTEVDTMHMYW